MSKLYICDYPYSFFSALIKVASGNEIADILLSDSLKDMEKIVVPLEKSGFFRKVYFFKDTFSKTTSKILPHSAVHMNDNKGKLIQFYHLFAGFLLILKVSRKAKKIMLPISLPGKYNEIIYNDRMSTLMFCLNSNKIPYSAMEHGKNIWKQKPNSELLKMKVFYYLEKLKLNCGINCYTEACNKIYVTDMNGIYGIPPNTMVEEWNIDFAISMLSTEIKNKIYQLYADSYGLNLNFEKTYNLLLTAPLFQDSMVSSIEQQKQFYLDQTNLYFNPKNELLIKPHPRDSFNYKEIFPNAIIIDSSIAAEVLSFSQFLKLDTVLTLWSSSTELFTKKANKVCMLEHKGFNPKDSAILKNYRSN